MEQSAARKVLAEFLGTFALVFIGAGAILTDRATGGQVGLIGIALAHGLVLAIMISAAGRVSGGHFNPAVTVGFMATGRIGGALGIGYIISQLLGGVVGGFFLKAIFVPEVQQAVGLGTPVLAAGVSFGTGIFIELILTFFLVFAIFGNAVDSRGPNQLAGFGIGTVLIFDILMGGPLTGASMNPARTFGPALAGSVWSDHLVYWIGPILGAVIAAWVYDYGLGGSEDKE